MKAVSPLGTVILAVLIMVTKQIYNAYQIKKKNGIGKSEHAVQISITMALYAILGWLSGGFIHIYYGVTLAVFYFTLFFSLFDLGLNLMIGEHPLYVGNTSVIDQKARSLGTFYHYVKFGALIVAVWLAYLIIHDGVTDGKIY